MFPLAFLFCSLCCILMATAFATLEKTTHELQIRLQRGMLYSQRSDIEEGNFQKTMSTRPAKRLSRGHILLVRLHSQLGRALSRLRILSRDKRAVDHTVIIPHAFASSICIQVSTSSHIRITLLTSSTNVRGVLCDERISPRANAIHDIHIVLCFSREAADVFSVCNRLACSFVDDTRVDRSAVTSDRGQAKSS
jgi:hypothetical protein